MFPESALLVLVWETLALSMGVNYQSLPVVFNNIKFHNEVAIELASPLKLSININRNENRFEVYVYIYIITFKILPLHLYTIVYYQKLHVLGIFGEYSNRVRFY